MSNYNRNDKYKLNFIFIESNYFLDEIYNKQIIEYNKLIDKPVMSEKITSIIQENTLDNLLKKKIVLLDGTISHSNLIKYDGSKYNIIDEMIEKIMDYLIKTYSKNTSLQLKKPVQTYNIDIYVPLYDENKIDFSYSTRKISSKNKKDIFNDSFRTQIMKKSEYIKISYENKYQSFLSFSQELKKKYINEKLSIEYFENLYNIYKNKSYYLSKTYEKDFHKAKILYNIKFIDKDITDIDNKQYYVIKNIKIQNSYLSNPSEEKLTKYNLTKSKDYPCIGKIRREKEHYVFTVMLYDLLKKNLEDKGELISFPIEIEDYVGGLFLISKIPKSILRNKTYLSVEHDSFSKMLSNKDYDKFQLNTFEDKNYSLFNSSLLTRKENKSIFFLPKDFDISEKDILKYSNKPIEILDLFTDASKMTGLKKKIKTSNKTPDSNKLFKLILKLIFVDNSPFYFFKIKDLDIIKHKHYKLKMDTIKDVDIIGENHTLTAKINLNLSKEQIKKYDCRQSKYNLIKSLKKLIGGKKKTLKKRKIEIKKRNKKTYEPKNVVV